MSRIDDLPPDQRAALALLLRRRESYEALAAILGIAPSALHDRAHAALAVLEPSLARELSPHLREQVGEYLLGQQSDAMAEATKAQLAASAPAREWARSLTVELMHLAAEPLPEIPAVAAAPAPAQPHSVSAAAAQGAQPHGPRAGGAGLDTGARPRIEPRLPSSRRGGALLLAAIAIVAIVLIVLILGNRGSNGPAHQAAATKKTPVSSHGHAADHGRSASAKQGGKGPEPKLESQFNLTSPQQGGSAVGIVVTASLGAEHALILSAERLQPSSGFHYVLWLIDTNGSVQPHPIIVPAVEASGRVQAATKLPASPSSYDRVEITKETESKPVSPSSEVVLEGAFKA